MDFRICEITSSSPPDILRATEQCLDELFPEYAPAHLSKRLSLYGDAGDEPYIQIFVVRDDERVLSFVQFLYILVGDRLICDIDLLGTRRGFRRRGLATGLFDHAMREADAYAHRYDRALAGVLTLIDHGDEAIRSLHAKKGGQIRTDAPHPSGDVVVWYPLEAGAREIETRELLGYVDAFGRMIRRFT
ncbi:MAG: GNAT family N-acetyltransferase [Anaerolineae bacterium]